MTPAFIMPRLSETCATGTILKRLVEPAASVEAGQAIVQIESDKAIVELESPDAGHIQSINFAVGGIVEAGMVLAVIAGPEESPGGPDTRQPAPQTSTQVAGVLPCTAPPLSPASGRRGQLALGVRRGRRSRRHLQGLESRSAGEPITTSLGRPRGSSARPPSGRAARTPWAALSSKR